MCDLLREMWFWQVFIPNNVPKRPQLLVLDSHSSHEDLGLLQEAVKENIILAMPPHTSHHLQPSDKCVFVPFPMPMTWRVLTSIQNTQTC